jgi:hypothetical protein
MLPSSMFSSPATSPKNRSPRPHPLPSNWRHPACPERSRRERSEGSWLVRPLAPIAPFEQSLSCELSTVKRPRLSRFVATLTDEPQLTENPATLSPVPATLTSRVKHNPFVCHSYEKHPGWGLHPSSEVPFGPRCCCGPSPVTSRQSPVTNFFTIRTSAKRARNPRRICTSKTQDLKPFRIRTYEKRGRGAPPPSLIGGTANRGCPLQGFASASHGSPVTNHATFVPPPECG